MQLLTFILSLISLPLSLIGTFILLNKELTKETAIMELLLNLLLVASCANISTFLGV